MWRKSCSIPVNGRISKSIYCFLFKHWAKQNNHLKNVWKKKSLCLGQNKVFKAAWWGCNTNYFILKASAILMGVTAEISKQQRHRHCRNPNSAENIPNRDVVHDTALTTPENPPGNQNFISPWTKRWRIYKQNSTFCENNWIVKLSTSGTALSEQEKRGPPKPGPFQMSWLGTPKIAAPAPKLRQIRPGWAGPAPQGSVGFSELS